MDHLWPLDRFSRWFYQTDAPTKGERDELTKMCRERRLPAVKLGRKWFVDTREILKEAQHA